jgi:hypothetical protein
MDTSHKTWTKIFCSTNIGIAKNKISGFSIKPSRDPISDHPPTPRARCGSRPEVGNHRSRRIVYCFSPNAEADKGLDHDSDWMYGRSSMPGKSKDFLSSQSEINCAPSSPHPTTTGIKQQRREAKHSHLVLRLSPRGAIPPPPICRNAVVPYW